MRKTDISKYAGSHGGGDSVTTPKSVSRVVLKALLTVFTILAVSLAIVAVSMLAFFYSLRGESMNYDLHKLELNYTSFIYVNGPNDDSDHPVQYQSLYSSENRIWVDYDQIPQSMKDAIVSIEDKRFWEHKGVDWKRTLGAVANLFNIFSSDNGGYGGSTITQQLIKNVTGENDVSLTRKAKEIFRALNLEKKYSKTEILTAYLNVVPFGSGCNGVQAAANLYFGKNIQDCDIAECAAIAGITQNPSAYSPLAHPEQNKVRQQTVLGEMHAQGKITDDEYKKAMDESEHMKFAGDKKEDAQDETPVWNWYVDALFEDVKEGLMQYYSCSSDKAVDMIYHGGLKIYSAMDTGLQTIAENAFADGKTFPANYPKLQGGYVAMDYSGRVLATVGARGEKTGNRLLSLAMDTKRQPGSTIKPLAVYGPAIQTGKYNFSSLVNDNPLPNWFSDGSAGPKNWGPGNTSGKYWGPVPIEFALERSLNAAAAQTGSAITPNLSFNFLKSKLNFTSLVPADNDRAPMSIGGLSEGVTVKEMTAGYQMFANGGKYYKPYTFYYVEDHDGNVIIDNRSETPVQALSSRVASVMHRLLNCVITGTNGTGRGAAISGWEVYGKTGTTNENKDSWFIGGTPYAVAGIWTGCLTPTPLNTTEQGYAKSVWKTIMTQYLKDKPKKSFTYDPNVVSASYYTGSGLLAAPGDKTGTAVGWYDKDNMPEFDTNHSSSSTVSSEGTSSEPVSGGSSSAAGENSSPDSSLPPESSGIGGETSSAQSEAEESSPGKGSRPNDVPRGENVSPGP